MHAQPFVPWEEPLSEQSGYAPARSCGAKVNISDTERLLSLAGGAALMLNGLFGPRRSRPLSTLVAAGLIYRGASGNCMGYRLLGTSTAPRDGLNAASGVPAGHGVRIRESIDIRRPAADLFEFWKRLDNLPSVMRRLISVKETGAGTSHWIAAGPLGATLEWDAEIFTEGENEFLAWRSLPGGDVDTAGSVHFRPLEGNRGTNVEVVLKYDPPGGLWVARLASLIGMGAEQGIREDLKRFKSVMEATAPK
jgi:uncharacterized membrane protein